MPLQFSLIPVRRKVLLCNTIFFGAEALADSEGSTDALSRQRKVGCARGLGNKLPQFVVPQLQTCCGYRYASGIGGSRILDSFN